MSNFEPRLSDATCVAAPVLPKYSLRQRLMSATLALTASGGGALMGAPAAFAHDATASWQTGAAVGPGLHTAVLHTASLTAPALSHAAVSHAASALSSTNSGAAAMHWLPSTVGQSAVFKTGSLVNAIAHSVLGADDINLYSPVAQFAAGSLAGFHTITIDVGGKQEQIAFNTKLTGAELLAAQQVLGGGKQDLVINASGQATGGSFNFNSSSLTAIDTALGGTIGSLDVSRGVALIDNLSNFTLTGSLVNFGTIYASGVGSTSASTISAVNIYNGATGVITSAGRGANLALNASGDFVNQGMVSAAHNLNLSAATMTNVGLVKATAGSVTIAGKDNGDIAFNGAGGTVQALKGDINFNAADFSGTSNITVAGGNFLSQNLNFNAGGGAVSADLGQVSGLVNGSAASSHITAATQDLKLGDIANAADPTYYNTAGDITIDGSVTNTGGADLAIVASGNIIANGGVISTTQTAGNSGNVTLIAGANITPAGGSGLPAGSGETINVTGASASGGYIDLSGITYTGNTKNLPVTAIDTSSATGNSGNVTMVAYAGTGNNSGNIQATATATQKTGAASINTSHLDPTKTGGDVTIIAGGTAVGAQNISVNAGGANASTITVLGAAPQIAGGGSLSITDGTVTGSYSTTPTTLGAANVTVGVLNGNAVNIVTAGTINEAKGGNIIASDITLTAASVGTAKAALLTNASLNLTVNGSSTTASFVTDGSSAAEIDGVSTAPGQAITVTETGNNLNVGNLNYTNVTLSAVSKVVGAGNITLNPTGASGFQVGEVYSTSANKTNALGNGVITITASGNIVEGAGGDTLPVVVGKTVVMTSTGGSIGQSVQTSVPVVISGAILTANAVKGSVDITDTVQTTLNAGSAATTNTSVGTGNYFVQGNGLAVAGAINGFDINLSTGPGVSSSATGSALALNANVGSTKSNTVVLASTGGIIEQNAKAVVSGANVVLYAPTGASIGSNIVPVLTKATATLDIVGSDIGASVNSSAYVNQTGNITLLAQGNSSTLGASTLVLKDSGVLTLGNATDAAVLNYGQQILQAANVVMTNSAFDANTVSFQSAAALSITGTAPTSFAVGSLHFEGTTAAGATTITLGNAKDGSSNPFNAGIFSGPTAVSNVVVNTKGNFVSSLSNISTSAGGGGANAQSISINAAALIRTGTPDGPFLISTASTTATNSGGIAINLTGSQTVSLSNLPTGLQIAASSGAGIAAPVSVVVKGALSIDGTGLQVAGGASGADLTLSAKSITVAKTAAEISAGSLTLVAPTIIVDSTMTAANSTVITATGALSVTGLGTINAGQNLTLGSTSVNINGLLTNFVASSITLGNPQNVTTGDPLAGSFGSAASATLTNLTIATTGNFDSPVPGFYLNTANPGSININAAAIVNSSISNPTSQAVVFNASGVGALPGSINVNLTGAQTIALGQDPGQLQFIATTDQAAGGGSVSFTSKGTIQPSVNGVTISDNGTVFLGSTGGSILESGIAQGSGLIVNSGANLTLTLSGAKGLSIQDPGQLSTNNITNLTLTSGSATTLTIGAKPSSTAAQGNWINGSIGTYTFGPNSPIQSANSKLDSLTINTGGGVTLAPGVLAGTISVSTTGTLIFNSSGQLTILGSEGSIQPGTAIGIYGSKGVTLGSLDAADSNNPFQFLTMTTDPVNALQIITPGTLAMGMFQFFVDVSGTASSNAVGPQVRSLASSPAALPSDAPPLTHAQIIVETKKLDNAVKSIGFQNLGGLFLQVGSPLNLPQVQTNALQPQVNANADAPIVTVNLTGTQNVVLSQDLNTPGAVAVGITVNGTQGAVVNVSTLGSVTAGITGNIGGAPISFAGTGSINITSGGNQIINNAAISLPAGAQSVALNLTSAKSLAIYDPTLLNNAALSSVSLTSNGAGSFVVGAAGSTFANGTAGPIAAPSVSILTPSLTNNSTIDGVGAGSGITLGSPGTKPFAVVATGTGTYGANEPFKFVNIQSGSNVNLGNLFTSTTTLGDDSAIYVNINAPAGTVTFSPAGAGISVGADTYNGGQITIDAKSLVFAPKTGPLDLSFDASATGSGYAGNIAITTASALTLGTAKGNIEVSVGPAANRGTISLTSTAGTLSVGGPTLEAGVLTLAGNNVVVGTALDALLQTSLQTNGKAGTGVISETSTGLITSDYLSIGQGGTKLAATPLTINVNTVALTGGALNLNDISSGGISVQGLAPLTALNLSLNGSSGQANISNIQTTNGSINIVDNIAFNQMEIFGSLTAINGSIYIQSNNSVGQSIRIDNATIYASGTAPGVGTVTIVAGAPPPTANLVAGLTPSKVTSVETVGGNIYFGNVGNTGGTISNSGSLVLNALGRNIIINEDGVQPILFVGNNTITADPPISTNQNGNQASYQPAARSQDLQPQAVSTPISLNSSATVSTSQSISPVSVLAPGLLAPSLSASGLQASGTTFGGINLTASVSNARADGSIFRQDGSSTQFAPLSGGVSNTSTRTLERGVTLLSPEQDTVVQTGFGKVAVAAHSVVMIMSFDGGVAVYNLHDAKRGSVTVKAGGQSTALAPGRSVVLTSRNIRCFEEINPAQSVGYRSLMAVELPGGVKAFQAEYSIMSLLQAADPLKRFVALGSKTNARATQRVLKTAAILMQSGNAKPFQTMTAPQLTAQALTR